MDIKELEAKARELKELKRMREELEIAIDAIEDSIKADIGDAESVIAGQYKITNKKVTAKRVDVTALKKAFPDLTEKFMKESTTMRFMVA